MMRLMKRRILKERGSLYPFLFMGCWNKEGSARDAVLDAISEDPVPLLVLGGDNAYPEKMAKKKEFILGDIMKGLDGLPKDKLIYVGIGNHNVDEHPVTNTTDSIFNVESNYPHWELPYKYYCVIFEEDRQSLVFLDTNLTSSHSEFKKMLNWLHKTLTFLEKYDYQYYVVQHEPFFSIKPPKSGKSGVRITGLDNAEDILDLLYDYPPIAILSADTHNYQEWDLNYDGQVFRQIVVGTGGASPDPVPSLQDLRYNTEFYEDDDIEGTHLIKGTPFSSITYKTDELNAEQSLGYGYYRIMGEGQGIFRRVRRWGGGFTRKKTQQRKQTKQTKQTKQVTRKRA